MFDIGWSEMLIVGVVALIVVGPKDLPKMFQTVGEVTGKARAMAREFQRAMDSAAREAGVSDIAKDLRKHSSGQSIKDAVGFGDIEKQFKSMGHDKPDVRTPGMTPSPDKASPDARNGATSADDDGEDADEAAVNAHDETLAARNADASEVEKQRLIKARRADAARMKAAAIRAQKEAEAAAQAVEEAEAEAWQPKPARQSQSAKSGLPPSEPES